VTHLLAGAYTGVLGTQTQRIDKLPMLASACPGWICYAEKTRSEMIPVISRTKSPQQIMGTLVKSWLGSVWGKQSVLVSARGSWLLLIFCRTRRPDQIYHVSVMPCYNEKLEASRQDFYNDIHSTRDVDCVITTGELELLMRGEKGWDLSVPVPGEDNTPCSEYIPELLVHPGTSSGSYLHTLMHDERTRQI
jgi:iron only hydrogenase large subunit-like protein